MWWCHHSLCDIINHKGKSVWRQWFLCSFLIEQFYLILQGLPLGFLLKWQRGVIHRERESRIFNYSAHGAFHFLQLLPLAVAPQKSPEKLLEEGVETETLQSSSGAVEVTKICTHMFTPELLSRSHSIFLRQIVSSFWLSSIIFISLPVIYLFPKSIKECHHSCNRPTDF